MEDVGTLCRVSQLQEIFYHIRLSRTKKNIHFKHLIITDASKYIFIGRMPIDILRVRL